VVSLLKVGVSSNWDTFMETLKTKQRKIELTFMKKVEKWESHLSQTIDKMGYQ
jgi:hypothetical protein